MAKNDELTARSLSIRALFLIAIGAVGWWAIFMVGIFSDLFYDDYRYVLTESDDGPKPVDGGESEPYFYYDSIYEPQIHPSTYLMLTAALVFSMTALWASQIAARANAIEKSDLTKTARIWSFIAVLIALALGVIFGFATFVSSLNNANEIDPVVRIFGTYVPILLAAALLVFVVLRAFVIKPGVENEK
jgi:hypothetical protein